MRNFIGAIHIMEANITFSNGTTALECKLSGEVAEWLLEQIVNSLHQSQQPQPQPQSQQPQSKPQPKFQQPDKPAAEMNGAQLFQYAVEQGLNSAQVVKLCKQVGASCGNTHGLVTEEQKRSFVKAIAIGEYDAA